jgi:hypothetical protein
MQLKWHLKGLMTAPATFKTGPLVLFHVVAPAQPFQNAQFSHSLTGGVFVRYSLHAFSARFAVFCKGPFITNLRVRKPIAVDHAMTNPPDRLRIHATWLKWTPEILITHPRLMAPSSSCTPFLCCRETRATMTHNSSMARSTQAVSAVTSK